MEFEFLPDRSSVIPLYAQLSQTIKDAILRGDLVYGDKLLSENEMVNRFSLSRMTVRTALSSLCSEKFVEKIHGKGAFVCYRPTEVKGNIDVILESSYTTFAIYYIQSISNVLSKCNYRFIFHDSHDNQDEICQILSDILATGTNGIILQPSHSPEAPSPQLQQLFYSMAARGIPYLILDRDLPGIPGPRMIFDDYTGGQLAAKHLLQLGHQRCAMICDSDYRENLLRKDGFNSILSAKGHPSLIEIEQSPALREDILWHIQHNAITAFFCFSDVIAVEAIRALNDLGISIPGEVSIVGYDDTILASAANPTITSVVHPKDILGDLAAKKMISLIEKTIPPHVSDIIDPKIAIRASSGPPPIKL